ncbi:MAG: TIGR00296 family protein [Candidatus Aenigmatarchaeota archaeon]
MLSKSQGDFLVRLARRTIENHVQNREIKECLDANWLNEKRGVFTTIETYPEHELRGCIGIPYPIKAIGEAVIESAKSACEDMRFPPLTKDELDMVVIEVSVLDIPEEIKVKTPKEYLDKIKPKKDGLIIRYGYASGLFLPQVWEKIPDKEAFLENLCMKAGLPPKTWKLPEAKIYRFSAQIFKEIKPRGKIVEEVL